MHTDYLQHLRYKLQKRFRRLNGYTGHLFHFMLQQFFQFINESDSFRDIIELLCRKHAQAEKDADQIVNSRNRLAFSNELEHAAVAYWVIKKCSESTDLNVELQVAKRYDRGTTGTWDPFLHEFVEPLYEYLDEQLDDTGALLSLVRRYKQKCEWFQKDVLFKLWTEQTGAGEKRLANHFYEYLHEQGMRITIEPRSPSGEIDVLADQAGERRLAADAKIFDPTRKKSTAYIISGFNQVYQYMLDHNETFGYLIIFKTAEHDLKFSLNGEGLWLPFQTHNNKSIYFATIDLYPYDASASKRGQLKSYEITGQELVTAIHPTQPDPGPTS